MSNAVGSEVTVPEGLSQSEQSKSPRNAVMRAILIVAVLVTFFQAFRYDFINLDDRQNIAQNQRFNPPTFQSVKFWWTHPEFEMYIPVMSTFQGGVALLAHVSSPDPVTGDSLNPWVFHAVNILLHVGVTLLVYQILICLQIPPWPACAGALMFGVHPVQVEPVVWITSLKDVLYGTFALLALWRLLVSLRSAPGDVDWCIGRAIGNYLLATFFFVLAMLSKPTAVILPLVAIPLVWVQCRAVPRQARIRIAIWLLLAIPVCIVARHAQPARFNLGVPIWQRVLVAGDALAFYLSKIVWPRTLLLYYGRNPRYILEHGFIWWTWLIPASLFALFWRNRKRHAPLLAGFCIFAAALIPVAGLVGFNFQYYSTVADRYLYLPMFGIALIAGSTLGQLPRAAGVASAAVLVALGARTMLQIPYWQDSLTLFGHVLECDPHSAVGNANFASELAYERNYGPAIAYARTSITEDPNRPEAFVTLAKALDRIGDTPESLRAFRDAIRTDPAAEEYLHGYTVALIHEGYVEHALPFARLTVELDPSASSHVELGAALAKSQDWPGARRELETAVLLDPKDYDARCILGSILLHFGDRPRALAQFQIARSIDPSIPTANTMIKKIGASDLR